MEWHGRISFQTKQISSNYSGCTRSLAHQRWIWWKKGTSMLLLQLLCQVYYLHFLSSVYWLMGVSQKPESNFRCDFAYRRLFCSQRLLHGPTYTHNSDYRLVEPDCFLFSQGLLAFSIHHLSNSMHYSHICLCYKSNVFPRFDWGIGKVF